jgi:hypothetical protein
MYAFFSLTYIHYHCWQSVSQHGRKLVQFPFFFDYNVFIKNPEILEGMSTHVYVLINNNWYAMTFSV